MKFDKKYFSKQIFSKEDLDKYKNAAIKDFEIAKQSQEIAVTFHFTYMALIKAGIYYLVPEPIMLLKI